MVSYFRTPEMQSGKGFRCHNCGKLLMVRVKGNCVVQLQCHRCKAFISIHLKEQVEWGHSEMGEQDAEATPA